MQYDKYSQSFSNLRITKFLLYVKKISFLILKVKVHLNHIKLARHWNQIFQINFSEYLITKTDINLPALCPLVISRELVFNLLWESHINKFLNFIAKLNLFLMLILRCFFYFSQLNFVIRNKSLLFHIYIYWASICVHIICIMTIFN